MTSVPSANRGTPVRRAAARPTAWYEPLLDAGWLPDWMIRSGIRRSLAARLAEERLLQRKDAFIQALRDSPIALDTSAANAQHYDVPAEFFELILGPSLKYSACLWPPGVSSLAEAEAAMLALTAERAQIQDGQRILELGCGWGSLTLFMAGRFPRSTIVAMSNSTTQRDFIERRAARRGLRNITVVTADMNHFDPLASFDRVVSVEMFEHMRNYPRLLERISRWLSPDGRLFVHVFAHRDYAYPYEARDASDWMAEHFFTGGTMPSADLLPRFSDHVQLEAQWHVSGVEYARTCEAWLRNMDAHRDGVDRIFRETYGAPRALQWRVRWRVFFMACAELFAFNGGREWFVAHYRFAPATQTPRSTSHD
jgi:cyclopropane-fatty-acyl-phospholipid synthase